MLLAYAYRSSYFYNRLLFYLHGYKTINGGVGMSTVIKILSNCPFYERECEECRHWDEEKFECEMAILQDRKI